MRLMKRWSVTLTCLPLTLASVGTAQEQVIEEEHDQVTRVSIEPGPADDQLLDEEGRVIAERHPDGTVVRYFYDSEGVRHVEEE